MREDRRTDRDTLLGLPLIMRTWMRSAGALLVIVGAMALHLGCIRLCCIACDGYLPVDGYVYGGLPSENGVVAVDSAVSKQDRVPISGCTVTLEPWDPDQRPDGETLRRLTRETVTNAGGHFATGGTAKPGHSVRLLPVCAEDGEGVWARPPGCSPSHRHSATAVVRREGAA
jgi:hypothetical protein